MSVIAIFHQRSFVITRTHCAYQVVESKVLFVSLRTRPPPVSNLESPRGDLCLERDSFYGSRLKSQSRSLRLVCCLGKSAHKPRNRSFFSSWEMTLAGTTPASTTAEIWAIKRRTSTESAKRE